MQISWDSYSFLLLIGLPSFGVFDLKLSDAAYLEDVCMQPFDEGQTCNNGTTTTTMKTPQKYYFFSTEFEKCVPFDYKGCGGNRNRFTKLNGCTDSCQIDWFKKKNKKYGQLTSNEIAEKEKVLKSPDDCNPPVDAGPCRALITMFFFDSNSGTCKQFAYGGCLGNKNRFKTEKQCRLVCVDKVPA